MNQAIIQAKMAAEEDEVPVGAVVVYKNKIIARAYNLTETLRDVTAHAEMLAITSASEQIGGKFMNECSLYVTLEPCIMCYGAIKHARFSKVVYGASDVKSGFESKYQILKNDKQKTIFVRGVLEEMCVALLTSFFAHKRK